MSPLVFISRAKTNFHLMFIVASSAFPPRIFIADGDLDDLRLVERFNWGVKGCIEWKDAQGRTLKELQALEARA